jgi:phosphinothricin acetyltransferase
MAAGDAIMPAMPEPCIRPAVLTDAAEISAIYNHYVRTSTCAYQEEPETLADRQAWLERHGGAHVVLVAEEVDGLAGWSSLSPFSERSAYRFTVEDSIYLRHDCCGRGLGRVLLDRLLAAARAGGFRSVVARISAEQTASIALHRRAGFREAGLLRRVGCKFGQWLDVVHLQIELADPPK